MPIDADIRHRNVARKELPQAEYEMAHGVIAQRICTHQKK
jgi:hypothetical protein